MLRTAICICVTVMAVSHAGEYREAGDDVACSIGLGPIQVPVLDRAGPTLLRFGPGTFFVPAPVHVKHFRKISSV